MGREECSKFDKCNATMCPMTAPEDDDYVWYPDEKICTEYNCIWIKNQRKIAKACDDEYFTYEMLNRKCMIKQGIKGLDPDKDEIPQLKAWMRAHPVLKRIRSVPEQG